MTLTTAQTRDVHVVAAGVALAFSFILLTVAEMFGAKSGMGSFIQYCADFSDYKSVLAGMVFNGIVILGITMIFENIKHRLLFWTRLGSVKPSGEMSRGWSKKIGNGYGK